MTRHGQLELTYTTYESLKPYTKTMPQRGGALYYTSLPITKINAAADVWVTPDGKREAICL